VPRVLRAANLLLTKRIGTFNTHITPPATTTSKMGSSQVEDPSYEDSESASPIEEERNLPQVFVENGAPVKFFIQQDTGEGFLRWLSAKIAEHGGIVVSSVPLKGYVLIDPDTKKGQNLKQKWTSRDKPHRHIVCYTFVRASIIAGKMIDPGKMDGARTIFKHNGMPVEIWLHPALDEKVARDLAIEIEKAGGVTETTEESTRVIVAPNITRQEVILFKDLTYKYAHSGDKYVEGIVWVRDCLNNQKYEHHLPEQKTMAGAKPGSQRVEYTQEDDMNLVQYVGKRIPNAGKGGRIGNNLYIELCQRIDEYPWAARHPWQSWRNRYRSRQLIFDEGIKKWLQENPPSGDGKGQFEHVRRPGRVTAKLERKKGISRSRHK